MIPGTTPTHIFRIPLLAADVAELRITYSQGGKVVLQKELKDIYFSYFPPYFFDFFTAGM